MTEGFIRPQGQQSNILCSCFVYLLLVISNRTCHVTYVHTHANVHLSYVKLKAFVAECHFYRNPTHHHQRLSEQQQDPGSLRMWATHARLRCNDHWSGSKAVVYKLVNSRHMSTQSRQTLFNLQACPIDSKRYGTRCRYLNAPQFIFEDEKMHLCI